ncbi:MAG TPA: hypothetical protein EYP79_04075 [Campylobacterales bacterium]|nr:hypothetical protein [Campylobacterales bacterium]
MRDRVIFYFYIFFLILFTLIHNIYILAIFIILLFIFSKKDFFYLFKKTFLSIIFFNFIVTISYLLMSLFKKVDFTFLILFNLRVFLLTYLTFWVFEKINIFKILPKRFAILIAFSFSQIVFFKNAFLDFWMGVSSRWSSFGYGKWINSLKSLSFNFLNKALHNSQEINMGMKSRGFFDD